MAMANISRLFFPNVNLTPTNQTRQFFSSYHHHHRQQRDFTVLSMASSSMPLNPLNNVEYLDREFKGHGVSFAEIGDSCIVRMGMENGSVASVMLPSGLITSYKAHMWHGSTMEILHTNVSESKNGVVIRGGMSVDFKCENIDGQNWSPKAWVLHDVRGDAEELIQIELRSRDPGNKVEFKNTVTLHPDAISSEVVVSNLQSSPLQLRGYFSSHLTVSTPDAAYVVGLEGSDYYNKAPFSSEFSIIPPEIAKSKPKGVFQILLSNWGRGDQEDADETEGAEKDNIAPLTEESCRIYTSAPREFTIMDRGRRNSVAVGGNGFDELYIFSPGSKHEWYGKYAYICTGPSAMLKPIILGPQGIWTGRQFLHNPNL